MHVLDPFDLRLSNAKGLSISQYVQGNVFQDPCLDGLLLLTPVYLQ